MAGSAGSDSWSESVRPVWAQVRPTGKPERVGKIHAAPQPRWAGSNDKPNPVEAAGAKAEPTGPTSEPQQVGKIHLVGPTGWIGLNGGPEPVRAPSLLEPQPVRAPSQTRPQPVPTPSHAKPKLVRAPGLVGLAGGPEQVGGIDAAGEVNQVCGSRWSTGESGRGGPVGTCVSD
jgi:hypothetical protein